MKIKNVSTKQLLLGDIKGQDNDLAIGEEREYAETDEVLLSYETGDIKGFVDAGWIQVVSTPLTEIETTVLTSKIFTWILSGDRTIKFAKEGAAWNVDSGQYETTADSFTVKLKVVDGDGTIDIFNSIETVEVVANGSASMAESMPIKFADGEATVTVNDAVNELVTLSLENDSRGLVITDTVKILFK